MAKRMNLEFNGVKYTLEFSRDTIRQMERQGFTVTEIESKPMTVLPRLFAGAFLKHHPRISADVVDNIFAQCPDKMKMIGKLAEMYNDPMEALLSDPEESEGNATWATDW